MNQEEFKKSFAFHKKWEHYLLDNLAVAIQPEWRCLVCPELRGHTTQLPASQELTALLGDMSRYGR